MDWQSTTRATVKHALCFVCAAAMGLFFMQQQYPERICLNGWESVDDYAVLADVCSHLETRMALVEAEFRDWAARMEGEQ